MRKKDYDLIANQFDLAIYDLQKTDEQREVLRVFAKQLAGRLEITEHKFDRQKFLTACGIESSSKYQCLGCIFKSDNPKAVENHANRYNHVLEQI